MDGKDLQGKPIVNLISRLGVQVLVLIRKEIDLIRTETRDSFKTETFKLIYFILAAFCGVLSLLSIVATVFIILQYFIPLWLSGVIVSMLFLLLAVILLLIGLGKSVKFPWTRTREIFRSEIKMARGEFT